jgi:FAD-dependent urate hydroxylase
MAGKAIVIGSGVGGLSAGLALQRAGYEVVVFERHPELRTAGVGLELWPNGVRVLDELGLTDSFVRVSNPIDEYVTVSSEGEHVSTEDTASYRARFGAPVAGVYRRDLNALIAEGLGLERIRFAHELVAFEDSGAGVTCRFENGSSETGDLLVGADGVFSRVRGQLFGELPFGPDRHVRWRGLFSVADAKVPPNRQVDVIGPHAHIGWIPIGLGRAYWYGAGDGLDDQESAMSHFNSWTKTRIPEIIAATPEDTIIRNDLFDLDPPLNEWGRGRVTLLGDAAHPMWPGMAQGACQALEDASMLARSMDDAGDLEDGLRRYEAARVPKATRIVNLSRSLFDYAGESAAVEETHSLPLFQRYAEVVEGPMANA